MSQSVYQKVMKADFEQLPKGLRILHGVKQEIVVTGLCDITSGTHWSSKMIRPLLGLPATETQARCKVVITPSNKGETWHRTMGESQFNSQQWAGDSLVFEQVGFSRLAFQMVVEKGKLHYQLSKLSIFGLPIPQFLWSEVRAVESMKNGYIHFDIRANGVFSHLLVKYEGLLDKVTSDGTVVWEKEGGPNES